MRASARSAPVPDGGASPDFTDTMQSRRGWLALGSLVALACALRLQLVCAVEHRWCMDGHAAHVEVTPLFAVVDVGWKVLFSLAVLLALLSHSRVRFAVYAVAVILGALAPYLWIVERVVILPVLWSTLLFAMLAWARGWLDPAARTEPGALVTPDAHEL